VHLKFPPKHKSFVVQHPLSFIGWFFNVAASMETLYIRAWDNNLRLLPQLLDTAAHKALNLKSLKLQGGVYEIVGSPMFDSLILFSQIKRLSLNFVTLTIAMTGDPTQMQTFLSLRSLEVRLSHLMGIPAKWP
jgi:hypothetical protein